MTQVTANQYKKGLARWCPGCGDHFFLANLHKAMAEMGVPESSGPGGACVPGRLPARRNRIR